MLKVCRIDNVRSTEIKNDPYLIVWIKFEPEGEEIIYWNAGKKTKSLIEITFEGFIGGIIRIVVPSIQPNEIKFSNEGLDFALPLVKGFPIFDLHHVGKFAQAGEVFGIDKSGEIDFGLTIGPNYQSIFIKKTGKPISYIVSDRARFGIDEAGYLSRIDIFNLNSFEMFQIKEAYEGLVFAYGPKTQRATNTLPSKLKRWINSVRKIFFH